MEESDIKRLALIFSVQAEIEAMKIYNLKYPENLGYGEDIFYAKAEELRDLAYKHRDEL